MNAVGGFGRWLDHFPAFRLVGALLGIWGFGPHIVRSAVPEGLDRPLDIAFVIFCVLIFWRSLAEIPRRARGRPRPEVGKVFDPDGRWWSDDD